jgi:HPt (histidine-containing phosphotransfer) domain-containing protein
MAKFKRIQLFAKLNARAYQTLKSATILCKTQTNPYVELVHWVDQIIRARETDWHEAVRYFALDEAKLAKDLTAALGALPRGAASISDFSKDLQLVIREAWMTASLAFNEGAIRTGHLLCAIKQSPDFDRFLLTMSGEFVKINGDLLGEKFEEIAARSPERGGIPSGLLGIRPGVPVPQSAPNAVFPSAVSAGASSARPSADQNAFPGRAAPGLDLRREMIRTGGESLYRKVLDAFREDAQKRLPLVREVPGPEALPVFTTYVHALKSTSAIIGAAELSAEAAGLEEAGKRGDLDVVREALPGFAECLEGLAEGIRAALEGEGEESPESVGTDHYLLFTKLDEALEAQNAADIDQILENLGLRNLDSEIRETLEQISDQILLADFDGARETLKVLLNEVITNELGEKSKE